MSTTKKNLPFRVREKLAVKLSMLAYRIEKLAQRISPTDILGERKYRR